MKEELEPVEGRLEAVENDVKEIYNMLKPTNNDLSKLVKDHNRRITALETA
jgi:hypothetical protein